MKLTNWLILFQLTDEEIAVLFMSPANRYNVFPDWFIPVIIYLNSTNSWVLLLHVYFDKANSTEDCDNEHALIVLAHCWRPRGQYWHLDLCVATQPDMQETTLAALLDLTTGRHLLFLFFSEPWPPISLSSIYLCFFLGPLFITDVHCSLGHKELQFCTWSKSI